MATAQPKTLQQAILFFSDYENCRKAVEAIRWPNGVVTCPNCGSDNVTYLATQRRYKCYGKHPKAQFSLKVGTIFEDSPLGLEKWLPALWMVTACKNGISSYELGRALGVTQKSAWFMLSRLRLALQGEDGGKLGGTVEVDETFIGGKARNMHKGKKRRLGISMGASMTGKVAVLGLLERHSKDGHSIVRLQGLDSRKKRVLQDNVRRFVEPGATVHTDELFSYQGLGEVRLRPQRHQPRRAVRGRQRPHQRHGELLEPAEADSQGDLRVGRTVPPFPLPR